MNQHISEQGCILVVLSTSLANAALLLIRLVHSTVYSSISSMDYFGPVGENKRITFSLVYLFTIAAMSSVDKYA